MALREWKGDMEADYIYTAGVAGERFFRELQGNGRILGAYCPRCDVIHLPPRTYCEDCFSRLEEWVEVPNKGRVETFTIARVDRQGQPLAVPEVWLLVKFPGIRGGLIHRTNLPPGAVRIGMEVEAVLKDHREGGLQDISHFKAI
jgi:uncharacterized OB-fold protein